MLSWLVHFCLVQILCIYCKQEFIEIMENKESKESMERKEIPRIRARNEGRPMVDASTFYGGLMRQYQDLLRVSVQETKERNNSRSSDASHEVRKILAFF